MTDQQAPSAKDPGVIAEILEANPELEGIGNYEYGWVDSDAAGQDAERGLDEDRVRSISAKKDEPEWMLNRRLRALKYFERKPMPVSYTHLTLPTILRSCRSRWSPYH